MEESGMEQSWARAVADTIVKAVEPLATKADLKADVAELRKDMEAGFELLREQTKSQVLELKVWILATQFILFGGLVATNVLL